MANDTIMDRREMSRAIWNEGVVVARNEVAHMTDDLRELKDHYASQGDECPLGLDKRIARLNLASLRLNEDMWNAEHYMALCDVLRDLDARDEALGFGKGGLVAAIDRCMRDYGRLAVADKLANIALDCALDMSGVAPVDLVTASIHRGSTFGPVPALQLETDICYAAAVEDTPMFLINGSASPCDEGMCVAKIDVQTYEFDEASKEWMMTNRAISTKRGDLRDFMEQDVGVYGPIRLEPGAHVAMEQIPPDLMRGAVRGDDLSVAACVDMLAWRLGEKAEACVPEGLKGRVEEARIEEERIGGLRGMLEAAMDTAVAFEDDAKEARHREAAR